MNNEGIKGHAVPVKILSRMLIGDTLPHSLLFTGISGIGKRLVARRVLNTLFCESVDINKPCLVCPPCRKFAAGGIPDFIVISPDEKGRIPIGNPDKPEENSVRHLISRLSKRSITGRFGVIIDGIDKISIEGQNALLKTLEEPQDGTGIIMISSNRSSILPTIISRSLEIHFNPLDSEDILNILKDHEPVTGFEAALSGGSVETTLMLARNDNIEIITGLAQQISDAASENMTLNPDLKNAAEKTGHDNLISVLVNFFRLALLNSIGAASFQIPEKITGDPEKQKAIIKILLASGKGLSNNMNISMLLKGLVYNHTMTPSSGFISLPDFFRDSQRR